MLSDDQRRRLEEEKNSLEQSYELQREKINRLRNALVIESDELIKFKYEKQIKQEENELKRLTNRLDEIEKQLQHLVESRVSLLKPIIQLSKAEDFSPQDSVAYTHLRDLLKEGDWRDADQETFNIMLKVTGKQLYGYHSDEFYLDDSDMNSIPLRVIRSIDSLWMKYSNERFGFSVQKDIWKLQGKNYRNFCLRVGWCKRSWIKFGLTDYLLYENLNFDTDAVPGHLPARWNYSRSLLLRRLYNIGGIFHEISATNIFSRI